MVQRKYRFFGRGSAGKRFKEMFEAPDDTSAREKVSEICTRRGITLDPIRDRLVHLVRKGIETQPVPLAA